jgi:hypothetical protein
MYVLPHSQDQQHSEDHQSDSQGEPQVSIPGLFDGTLLIAAAIIVTHIVCMILIVRKIDAITKTLKENRK